MTIDAWWKKARKLSSTLDNLGKQKLKIGPAKSCKAVRDELFGEDGHHPPTGTHANKLLSQVEVWMTRVKGGTYGSRFKPAHTGPYKPH